MLTTPQHLLAVLAGTLAVAACDRNTGDSVALQRKALATPDTVGATVFAFKMRWPSRTLTASADRLHQLTQVVAQKQLKQPSALQLGVWAAPYHEAPTLMARYQPEFDRFQVLDRSVFSRSAEPDIGPNAAELRMNAVVQELVQRQLIDARHYTITAPRLGYLRGGAGRKNSPNTSVSWIDEYRFVLPRVVNGIEVLNADLLIGIHRSGSLTSLWLGGIEIMSVWSGTTELPTADGALLTRSVAVQDIAQRFQQAVPQGNTAKILWERLMYVMPEGAREAVVEPSHVYSYVLAATGAPLGGTPVSRRFRLAYSLTSATALPISLGFPKPVLGGGQQSKSP